MRKKCQFCLGFVCLLRNISSVICWLLQVHSWPTPAMLALVISSAYHLYGNFGENFPSNGTGNFFASKQELDWIVPFTKYRQIFCFLSRGILALVIQTNGTENFGCSGKSILIRYRFINERLSYTIGTIDFTRVAHYVTLARFVGLCIKKNRNKR